MDIRTLLQSTLIISVLFTINTSNSIAQSWVPLGQLGFSQGESRHISLAFSPVGEPYVAYQDYGNFQKATVMKFNGSNWIPVGNPGFSEGAARATSLGFSPAGEPHVVYQDDINNNKATVMRFNGTNWVPLGMVGFSDGNNAAETSLVFSPTGEPYVLYGTFTGSAIDTIVMKFNGTNWVAVGSPILFVGGIEGSLAFNAIGEPHIAFTNNDISGKATVLKFDGSNWITVGVAGFSEGEVSYISLAFSPITDEPYVAYTDYANSLKETVMKFDGNNWISVGFPGFSSGKSGNNKLVFNSSGEPYIAYIDYVNSHKCTVMKFEGNNWSQVGMAGFSAVMNSGFFSFAFSPDDIAHLAYQDSENLNKVTVMEYNYELGIDDFASNERTLNVSPNPVKDILTITNIAIGSTINIVDAMGKTIYNSTNNNEQQLIINTESFSKGLYIIQVLDNGIYVYKKLVKS